MIRKIYFAPDNNVQKTYFFYIAVIFRHSCLPIFAWQGSFYVFSTRNNCSEFLASYGVILKSDFQPYSCHLCCREYLEFFPYSESTIWPSTLLLPARGVPWKSIWAITLTPIFYNSKILPLKLYFSSINYYNKHL